MFASKGKTLNNSNKGHNNGVPSSSSSKLSTPSTSSSSSPLSPPTSHLQTPRTKTMEEVWKDINLSSLHDHPSREDFAENPVTSHHPHTNFRGMTFQDFLARPFSKDSSPSSAAADHRFYGSPAPPPATVLSLNSGPEFHFLDNSDPLRPHSHLQSHPLSNLSSFSGPFDALASCSGLASLGRKRLSESDNSSGDRRHKRMIKNRESAARSRARKQAYTNELELEVAHLLEENARLKRQQEQLCLAADAQLPKKHTLQRTSTAPF